MSGYLTESINPIMAVEKVEQIGKLTKTDLPNYDRFKESIDFSIKHDKVKDRVKSILMFDKFSRKNDLWLYLIYLVKCGYIKLQIDISDFKKANPPESISRARRLIYSEIRKGQHKELKYLIDNDIEETRKDQEELYRGYFQDKNNSELARVIK